MPYLGDDIFTFGHSFGGGWGETALSHLVMVVGHHFVRSGLCANKPSCLNCKTHDRFGHGIDQIELSHRLIILNGPCH